MCLGRVHGSTSKLNATGTRSTRISHGPKAALYATRDPQVVITD